MRAVTLQQAAKPKTRKPPKTSSPAANPISISRTEPYRIQRSPACACGGGCPDCKHDKFSLQPKLKIGAPNDRYEQEADRVADLVMRMPEPSLQRKPP